MANEDYGILVTSPGASVQDAPTSKLIMDTSKPFIKIDTQNPTGFQTITLLITTDPPEPPLIPGGNTYTVVYQFAHGYKYVPSVEALFNVTSPPPGTAFSQDYFLDRGLIGQHTAADGAFLYAATDATNVYFIVNKFIDGSGTGMANLLSGTNIDISVHVFVEEVV